jgi:hypothetical protein
MQYSLDKISTVQACDDLLMRAQEKKQTLERRRRNQGESVAAVRKRMDRIEKELANVYASLDALTIAYQAMPEGKDRMIIHIRIKRLELRQAVLEMQASTCNVANLLVRELKYNRLDSQVLAMEDYIAAVERLKTALLNQPVMGVNRADDLSRPPVTQQRQLNFPISIHTKARRFERKWIKLSGGGQTPGMPAKMDFQPVQELSLDNS